MSWISLISKGMILSSINIVTALGLIYMVNGPKLECVSTSHQYVPIYDIPPLANKGEIIAFVDRETCNKWEPVSAFWPTFKDLTS